MRRKVRLAHRFLATCALCLLLVSGGSACFGDTFRLTGGGVVRGELLKERPESYVVDLGFEIVIIPKEAVEEHLSGSEEEQEAQGPAPAEGPPVTGESAAPSEEVSGGLHTTARQVARGVRETARKFGPAVVTVSTPDGLGSGFVIDADGHAVTNAHVIQGETRITLTVFLPSADSQNGKGPPGDPAAKLERKKIEKVRIIAVNPYLDLALLQASELADLKVPHVFLGESETLRVGEQAFAIGAPLGLERSVSQGIVSTVQRNLRGVLYVQTTAAVNPGNSGGPLFDARGRVVGVINAKAFGAEGVGFAIPVFYLKHFLDHYEAFAYDKDNPNTGYHYLPPPGAISLEEDTSDPTASQADGGKQTNSP